MGEVQHDEQAGPPSLNDMYRMRSRRCLFIAAEAYARDNNEQMARERINHYLQLVSADPIADNVTGDALVQAILAEKYKEFVGEGSNYFDLKRSPRRPEPSCRYGAGSPLRKSARTITAGTSLSQLRNINITTM